MPERDTAWPAGTPCWIDYAAADLDAAQEFYRALLGWDYTPGRPEFGDYAICTSSGRDAAGMMPRMAASDEPGWTTYFATDDAGATAAAVTAAGGTVVAPPMEVGPQGRLAVFLDPQGLLFGVWQAGARTGVQVVDEPGSLTWSEAASPDPSGAQAFYGEVFGFRFEAFEGADDYWTFATGDRPLGGLGGVYPGGSAAWSTCFAVGSVDDAVTITQERGGKVIMPAEDMSFGRFAVVADPWGATFSVMQAAPGQAPGSGG